MDIHTELFEIDTKGQSEIYNVTESVRACIEEQHFDEGQATVFGVGSTSGVSTLEFEPGLVGTDVREMFDLFAPYGKPYRHNQTWGDDNGASHLRSFLTGTSLTVPFAGGKLILGTWQQIVIVDYDTSPRQRRFAVQLMGRKGGT